MIIYIFIFSLIIIIINTLDYSFILPAIIYILQRINQFKFPTLMLILLTFLNIFYIYEHLFLVS